VIPYLVGKEEWKGIAKSRINVMIIVKRKTVMSEIKKNYSLIFKWITFISRLEWYYVKKQKRLFIFCYNISLFYMFNIFLKYPKGK